MFEALISYISSKISLNDYEIAQIQAIADVRSLRKGEILLESGQVCDYSVFIVRGTLRLYRTDANGEEHILRFGIENWWINDSESYNTGIPSKSYIDAIEDAEIIILRKDSYNALLDILPKLRALTEELTARSYDASQERIYSAISLTSEEKYANFLKKYPDIFNRVSLQMIASYLGISRKTLGRIRKKK